MTSFELISLTPTDTPDAAWIAVIDFWFGAPGSHERGERREVWWGKDEEIDGAEFDAQIRDRFLSTHEAALAGDLDHWLETPAGALALVITLDQFPRNMFRKSARAFAADGKSLLVAKEAMARGYADKMSITAQQFLYIPFEHAEDLAEQQRSVDLYTAIGMEDGNGFAQHHYDIVKMFGRFPHRNEVLGRQSTSEEIEYIKDPANRFGQ